MELFDEKQSKTNMSSAPSSGPLAEKMRPSTLEDFYGQGHILGESTYLKKLITNGELQSLILWGPPGTGKTTLARIIANGSDAVFVEFSAVLSGVKDIREVTKQAEINKMRGKDTILFVDEIHRFNKSQQDAFLHHVEEGTITLIGATTENPSFEINAPLLSRCKVLTLEQLSKEDIKNILERALKSEQGLGAKNITISEETLNFISDFSDGDARYALNTLDTAVKSAKNIAGAITITTEAVKDIMDKQIVYDKNGEEHYNVISAFIKSMRGSDPDAALYYLARMLEGGEDPMFIARRMVIFASEDIGNADTEAIKVALSVKDSVHFVGMPEGSLPLAQGVTYLATAPKSNASYSGYLNALKDVKENGALPVPKHIRNAPTNLMKEMDYGKGYKYPHNYENSEVEQDYLPDKLKGKKYYKPVNNYSKGKKRDKKENEE